MGDALESLPALRARVWDLRDRERAMAVAMAPAGTEVVDACRRERAAAEAELTSREAEPSAPCPRCHGSGTLTEDPLPGCPAGPSVYEARECPACEGMGERLTETKRGT